MTAIARLQILPPFAALLALAVPAHADPAADLALLFSDLCVETGLSIKATEAAHARVTHGEKPLEAIVTDRDQIYSHEVRIGDVEATLQALANAGSATFRNCRLSAQFPDAASVEVHLDRLFPAARRTPPVVQRMRAGDRQLIAITVDWLLPRPRIASVQLTVEVLGDRRKATLTALPRAD